MLRNLGFSTTGKTNISWTMSCESTINQVMKNYLSSQPEKQKIVRKVLLEMDAVNLLLRYLYAIQRKREITKTEIYNDFFEAPFVKQYLDRHGLDNPTADVRCRRIPFLLNILEALGIINQTSRKIEVLSFIPSKEVMKLDDKESIDVINERIYNLQNYTKTGEIVFEIDVISQLKELYGANFLTQEYYLPISEI